MSNITDKLLSEIQEHLDTDSAGRTAVRVPIKKVEAKVPIAAPLKKATAAQAKIFKGMCVTHEAIRRGIKKIEVDMTALRERLNERKGRLGDVKTRIGEFCFTHGVTVRTEDKAFYERPWKAQAEVKRNKSTMAEPIRAWAAKKIGMLEMLFIPDPEAQQTLNVTGIRRLLETETKIDPALRTKLVSALNALVKLADAEGMVHHPEAVLNLEAYDRAKEEGLIPAKVVEEAEENATYIDAVSVDKIIDLSVERCGGCSEKLPKKRDKGHQCKRCGTVCE